MADLTFSELEFIKLNPIDVLLDLRNLYAQRTVASENHRFVPFDCE
jgi:hypothetical protein